MLSLSLVCTDTTRTISFYYLIKKRKNETNADNKIHAKTSLFHSTIISSPQLNLNFCCVLTFETTTSTDENKIFHSILISTICIKKENSGDLCDKISQKITKTVVINAKIDLYVDKKELE